MAELFHVSLTPDQELAPAPSRAHGEGHVYWHAEAGLLTFDLHVTGVDFAPLGGLGEGTEATADDVTNLHLHNAARGEAGAVVFNPALPLSGANDLTATQDPDGSWHVHGVWNMSDPALSTLATFADDLTAARPGEDVPLYFNVHTTGVSTGEIRGQWVAAEADHGQVHHGWEADAALA